MTRLRSAAFSLLFPIWTGICCIALAAGPLLPRRRALALALVWIRSVAWIERHILGLDYRIIGAENLPSHGAFIVAAKHQSTFETMKLHLILNDPAIVLKKELLRIPIWGRYLKQTGMIPIDRGAGRRAVGSMLTASQQAKADGRPIVIFPQGTRVPAGATRAYKSGVVALYQQLGLPILPLALNSGLFWPKRGMKHGGTVTFSFLTPIEPGMEPEAALSLLEERLEAETNRLVAAQLQGTSHS
ncbi:MAG: putative acyltransferase [Rhodospirillales bacterium]|nr:putative acyltransferase [Rhodospirillales bacterium]